LKPFETLNADEPLELQLNCFGYFGFASGFSLAAWGNPSDTREAYCGRACVQADACWQRHRARVRGIVPDLAATCDRVGALGLGDKFMAEFARQSNQPIDKVIEPYTAIMMGNMQDGAYVATTGVAKQRGECTLTWPLTPLTVVL